MPSGPGVAVGQQRSATFAHLLHLTKFGRYQFFRMLSSSPLCRALECANSNACRLIAVVIQIRRKSMRTWLQVQAGPLISLQQINIQKCIHKNWKISHQVLAVFFLKLPNLFRLSLLNVVPDFFQIVPMVSLGQYARMFFFLIWLNLVLNKYIHELNIPTANKKPGEELNLNLLILTTLRQYFTRITKLNKNYFTYLK